MPVLIRPIVVLFDLSEVNFCITYPIQKKWRATVKINCMPIYGKCIDSLSIWILSISEKSGYLSLRQISQLKDYFWRNWADSTSLLSICFSIHDVWNVGSRYEIIRVLATVKTSAVIINFPIWPIVELPNLCFPNT